MAYNDRKILKVLLGELKKAPERCEDYREDLGHLLADVLNFERDHAISRTNIVQKIAEQVNALGIALHSSRAVSNRKERKAS